MAEILKNLEVKNKSHLELTVKDLLSRGGLETAREICQQPSLWLKTLDLVSGQQQKIENFLQKAFQHKNLEIILTGAGTSAFIGNILQAYFEKNTQKRVSAIASTELISHPQLHLPGKQILMVSFARSGNSPESLAAVNLANRFCEKAYHLIITCNRNSELVNNIQHDSTHLFFLPEEAEDRSVAMTGSFTSMLLAGLLISRIGDVDRLKPQIDRLAGYGERLIQQYASRLKEIANLNFTRAVFLGSGPMKGIAKESDLKVQELTAGKVICKHDSFLGFRHGPKVVIDPSTLLVYLFSNNAYVHQYETDLVKSINAGDRGLFQLGIIESGGHELGLDLLIELSGDKEKIDEEFLCVCSVLPAQMIGFFKSLQLGLKPDNSAENGTITRVVQGVTIYPFPHDGSQVSK